MVIDNANVVNDSGNFKEFDAETLFNVGSTQTSAADWTEIVELSGSYNADAAFGLETGSDWTLQIVDERDGISVVIDGDGRLIFQSQDGTVVKDVDIRVFQSADVHEIDNVDEITWVADSG